MSKMFSWLTVKKTSAHQGLFGPIPENAKALWVEAETAEKAALAADPAPGAYVLVMPGETVECYERPLRADLRKVDYEERKP